MKGDARAGEALLFLDIQQHLRRLAVIGDED